MTSCGSHTRGRAGRRSDLNLLVVDGHSLDSTIVERLIEVVKRLHLRHALDLDEEVPYAVKLYAPGAEVAAATAFGGFGVSPIPRRKRQSLRARPQTRLPGDQPARPVHPPRPRHHLGAIRRRKIPIRDPHAGTTGEDRRGYADDDLPHLHGLVQQGFARLAPMGVFRPADAATFDQRHNARRSLFLRITAVASAPAGNHRRGPADGWVGCRGQTQPRNGWEGRQRVG
jgi:hypothetical protein